ncbi:drop dead [Lycorma delicatula]|uniref:drop dead n=1 Tax=Lycorma delicatula TaxID=130591 RepID=UPI003F513779
MKPSTKIAEILPAGLGKKLTSTLPPFAPINSRDPVCRNHSRIYLQELEKFNLWALRMHDSTAKLPSGLLNGNVNQLGDFDQCLGVQDEPGGEIRGQYCLTYIELKLHTGQNPELEQIYSLVQSHSAFKSNLEDPGHRVPRFNSINWAVCVPSSCSAADIEEALLETVNRHIGPTGLRIRVQVATEMCQVKSDSIIPPTSSLLVLGFFLVVLGIIGAATVVDYGMKNQPPTNKLMEVLLSFSLLTNSKKLFSVTRSPDDIPSIHGIRALNAFMLLVSHKSMALFFNPYINRTSMTEILGQPWTVVARAASLYTDPFIMLSGLLTSYAFLKHLNRSQSLDIPKEFISRLMRLIPTLGALILFCTFILPWLGSGPHWNLVIRHHAELCKVSWWKNILFIHNYFGFKNMCLTHTHHVGIDTQLFLVSPILVKIVWKWPKQGLTALLALGIYSTVLRFSATYFRQLNLFVYFGNPVSQMFDTADYSYILPTHRLTVYVMGVALGYGLHFWGRDFKLKTGQLTLGWFVALVLLYQSILSPVKMSYRNYVYDRLDAANYAAFAPVTWCLFFSWIIFCAHTGNGGFLCKIFSWKGFLVCTRLSYTFYLTQFPVFFYYVGQVRTPMFYSFFLIFDFKELTIIIITSIILTLMFEIPFQNLRTIILNKPTSSIHNKKPLSARL